MSEKDLGRALLDLDSRQLAGIADPREQTWRILERDRRRVWWLTALSVFFWAAAILMVLWMMIAFALIFPLQAKLRDEAQLARVGLTPEMGEEAQFKAQIMFQMAVVGVTVAVGVTCLAVLASLLLNIANRRATLRQINASLLEISQQLKELKHGPAKPAA
jgi:ABC-type Fe3+ transport system permease subunit